MNFYQAFAALSFFVLFTTGHAYNEQCVTDIEEFLISSIGEDAGEVQVLGEVQQEEVQQVDMAESLEEACKKLDGNAVEVSVAFSNDACSAPAEGWLPPFFCIPRSCGSDTNAIASEFATGAVEQELLLSDVVGDDCKDFEVTVVGGEEDTTSAGAQSQHLSSLGFFLIQGVIVSSFMVVML